MSCRRCLAWIGLLVASQAACSANAPLSAREVLKHSQCQGIAAGVNVVDADDLGKIRGGLLNGAEQAPPSPARGRLFAISRGPQPTPGYGFELADASVRGHVATIRVEWLSPSADAVQAQVVTHPCLVVDVARGDLQTVRVVDQNGQEIGSTQVPR